MNSMSRKFLLIIAFLLPGGVYAQGADNGVGIIRLSVLDVNAALFNTERARAAEVEMKLETASDEEKIRSLASEAQALQDRLLQDAAVLSQSEQTRIAGDIEEISVQYQFLVQKLSNTLQERRQQFQQAYAPNLVQAISDVVEEGNFDIVFRAEVVIHHNTAFDITARVTEKLNQQE